MRLSVTAGGFCCTHGSPNTASCFTCCSVTTEACMFQEHRHWARYLMQTEKSPVVLFSANQRQHSVNPCRFGQFKASSRCCSARRARALGSAAADEQSPAQAVPAAGTAEHGDSERGSGGAAPHPTDPPVPGAPRRSRKATHLPPGLRWPGGVRVAPDNVRRGSTHRAAGWRSCSRRAPRRPPTRPGSPGTGPRRCSRCRWRSCGHWRPGWGRWDPARRCSSPAGQSAGSPRPSRGRVRTASRSPGASLARQFTHQPQEGGAERPGDAPAQRGPVRTPPAAPSAAAPRRLRLGLPRLDEADVQLPLRLVHGSRLREPLRARGARPRRPRPAHGAGRSGRSGGIGIGTGGRHRLRRGPLLATGRGPGERHSRGSWHSTPLPEEVPL